MGREREAGTASGFVLAVLLVGGACSEQRVPGPPCETSVADYCAKHSCDSDLATAQARACGGGFLVTTTLGCGNFDVLVIGGVDTSSTEYFDENTGALVAVVNTSANLNSMTCAGVVPMCSGGATTTCPNVCGDDAGTLPNPGVDGGVCTPGESRCSADSVQTCLATGQWGGAWPCASGACTAGACSGATTAAPSCTAQGVGLSDCGADHESCCTSLEVPGGSFFRTYVDDGSSVTCEGAPASVSGFRLDKYDVTVGRYRQFWSAWGSGASVPAAGAGKHLHANEGNGLANSGAPGTYEPGWVTSNGTLDAPMSGSCLDSPSTWTSSAGPQDNLPMTCVNWFEAYAFCIWDGGFLPSEAEWEYAAAGGGEQRRYPWGATDPAGQIAYANYQCACDPFGACPCIAPVGTSPMGAGAWGELDLFGNVWNWTLDWFDATYPGRCIDCAEFTQPSIVARVVRGGSFASSLATVPEMRAMSGDAIRLGSVGFRCARSP